MILKKELLRQPAPPPRDTQEIMEDILKVPAVQAVLIIGRDGFVIEATGHMGSLDMEALGASLASTVNSVEEMGSELEVEGFRDLFVEYGKAMILSKPVGDAVAALVCPDASKLGIVRHKTKKLLQEISEYL